MNRAQAIQSIGFLAAAIGVLMVAPQMMRVIRHPQLPGVSVGAWALSTLACFTWLSYGIRTHQLPQIPGNLLFVGGAATITLLVPSQVNRRTRGAALAAATAAIALLSVTVTSHLVGYLAFAITLTASWPQLIASYDSWRLARRSGVSVLSWALATLCQSCWLIYAVGSHDLPITITASVTLASSAALTALEIAARSASKGPAPSTDLDLDGALPGASA